MHWLLLIDKGAITEKDFSPLLSPFFKREIKWKYIYITINSTVTGLEKRVLLTCRDYACFASLAVNSRGNGGLHKQSKRPATTGSYEKRENSLPSPPIRLIRIASEINEPILESKERKFFAQVLNSGSKVVPAELNRTLGFRSKVNEEKVARVT